MSPDELTAAHKKFRQELFEAGLFIPTGVDGLYGRSEIFERVLTGIDNLVCRTGAPDNPVIVEYPPLITTESFDTIGYLRNFPQLAGTVHSFHGNDRDHAALTALIDNGEPYGPSLSQTEVTLTPACCYPVYPSLRGTLPEGGVVYEIRAYCFRHEPSVDPMRLQSFRQREHVKLGTPDEVLDWRERWLQWAPEIFAKLGLDARPDIANDPFFGRAGRLMSISQREQQLKIEFLIPVFGEEHPTACSSINYHQDHFGDIFDIHTTDGERSHSSCIGFGLERCTVAMFATHGLDVNSWPASVTSALWP